jgi:hypothetical protein
MHFHNREFAKIMGGMENNNSENSLEQKSHS